MCKKPLNTPPYGLEQISTWLAARLLGLPRTIKSVIALMLDASLAVLAVWLAFYLRLGVFIPLSGNALLVACISILIALPIFAAFGLYRAIFHHHGWVALLEIARAMTLYAVVYMAVVTAIGIAGVPRTIGIIQPILFFLFVVLARVLASVWLGDRYQNIRKRIARPKVLIYGAGQTGQQLATVISHSYEMQVAGFLDDDVLLHNRVLNGLPVYHPARLIERVATLDVHSVLLALPSIPRTQRNEILRNIRQARVRVRTLPRMLDIVLGKISLATLCDLDVDDILGRDPVRPDMQLLTKNIRNQVVMVTGAGGSIGGELCRQIVAIGAKTLLLVEQSEFALYAIHQALTKQMPQQSTTLVPLLASVQNATRMHALMGTWQPHTVYHAAAYKHVPLVEHNLLEGIANNVLGTWVTAQSASKHGVRDFVLISTDKAVRPTNMMGASKRLAEIILQSLATTGVSTQFCMVRFGNVLESSGSVVPKFRQQILDGGPITLTHPEITRYFMTITEAAQLVIQAGALATGGETFVLDMGAPVKIMDMAKQMIALAGLTVKDAQNERGDIALQITGLRPGEKLYEELLIGNHPQATAHPRIMRAQETFIEWAVLQIQIDALEQALHTKDVALAYRLMQTLVAEYVPSTPIVDWVYAAQKSVHTAATC